MEIPFDKTQPTFWNGLGVSDDRIAVLEKKFNEILSAGVEMSLGDVFEAYLALCENTGEAIFTGFAIGELVEKQQRQ